MFWVNASCVLVLLVAALAVYFVSRRLYAALAVQRQLESTLGELKILVDVAHDTTARLEAAIRRAEALQPPRRDTRASIEGLADPGALADASSLVKVADQLPRHTSDPAADIFEQDEKALSVARLQGQGLKPAEISRRLSLPIGEVEFLLSLRPNSQA
jgi:DNA-binding NarL/FixJ family response regulator